MLLLPLLLIIKMRAYYRTLAFFSVIFIVSLPAYANVKQNEDVRNPFLRKVQTMQTNSAVIIESEGGGADAVKVAGGEYAGAGVGAGTAAAALDPNERDPLLRVSVGEIYVIGTVTSPHMNIAFVRTRDGYKAPLRTGEDAGVEGFSVSMIDNAGVSLRKGDKIIRIPVHNPTPEDVYVDQSR